MAASSPRRQTYDAPIPILAALELLWATIARGTEGDAKWYAPADGLLEVKWLNRKGTYRFTLDLMPPGTQRADQNGR